MIAAWTDRCPLAGVCSECGLKFAWADVLNPVLRAEAWLIEHAEVKLGRALIRTIPRAAWPGAIWRTVEMRHPIQILRLAVLACVAVLIAHAAVSLGLAGTHYLLSEHRYRPGADALRLAAWPYRFEWDGLYVFRPFLKDITHAAMLLLTTTVVTPLAFMLLGDSLRRARVWPGHLVRCGLYSMAACATGILMALCVIVVLLVLKTEGSWSSGFQDTPIRWQAAVAWAAGLVFMWWWWRSTVRDYLRLPRAGMVAAAMLVIAGLAVPTAYLGLWWVIAPASR